MDLNFVDLCDSDEEPDVKRWKASDDKSIPFCGNINLAPTSTTEGPSTSNNTPLAECNLCRRSFSTPGLFFNHMKFYHGYKDLVKCTFCDQVFTGEVGLKFHVQSDHKSYPCESCGEKFNFLEALKAHKVVHAVERKYTIAEESRSSSLQVKKFSCSICLKSFLVEKALLWHEKRKHFSHKKDQKRRFVHGTQKPYASVLSRSRNFRQNSSVSDKVNITRRNEGLIKCPDCDESFEWMYLFRKHKEVHYDEKRFSCPTCPEKFRWKNNLKLHEFDHLAKYFVCKYCGKPNKSRVNLTAHEREHKYSPAADSRNYFLRARQDKPSVYTEWDSQSEYSIDGEKRGSYLPESNDFSQNVNQLTNKTNVETDLNEPNNIDKNQINTSTENSYTLRSCNQPNGSASKLNSFSFVPSKRVQLFVCRLCQESFSFHFPYEEHMETHKIKKKFCCNTCDKPFSSMASRKAHVLLTHSLNPVFRCIICRKPCENKGYLKDHLKSCYGLYIKQASNAMQCSNKMDIETLAELSEVITKSQLDHSKKQSDSEHEPNCSKNVDVSFCDENLTTSNKVKVSRSKEIFIDSDSSDASCEKGSPAMCSLKAFEIPTSSNNLDMSARKEILSNASEIINPRKSPFFPNIEVLNDKLPVVLNYSEVVSTKEVRAFSNSSVAGLKNAPVSCNDSADFISEVNRVIGQLEIRPYSNNKRKHSNDEVSNQREAPTSSTSETACQNEIPACFRSPILFKGNEIKLLSHDLEVSNQQEMLISSSNLSCCQNKSTSSNDVIMGLNEIPVHSNNLEEISSKETVSDDLRMDTFSQKEISMHSGNLELLSDLGIQCWSDDLEVSHQKKVPSNSTTSDGSNQMKESLADSNSTENFSSNETSECPNNSEVSDEEQISVQSNYSVESGNSTESSLKDIPSLSNILEILGIYCEKETPMHIHDIGAFNDVPACSDNLKVNCQKASTNPEEMEGFDCQKRVFTNSEEMEGFNCQKKFSTNPEEMKGFSRVKKTSTSVDSVEISNVEKNQLISNNEKVSNRVETYSHCNNSLVSSDQQIAIQCNNFETSNPKQTPSSNLKIPEVSSEKETPEHSKNCGVFFYQCMLVSSDNLESTCQKEVSVNSSELELFSQQKETLTGSDIAEVSNQTEIPIISNNPDVHNLKETSNNFKTLQLSNEQQIVTQSNNLVRSSSKEIPFSSGNLEIGEVFSRIESSVHSNNFEVFSDENIPISSNNSEVNCVKEVPNNSNVCKRFIQHKGASIVSNNTEILDLTKSAMNSNNVVVLNSKETPTHSNDSINVSSKEQTAFQSSIVEGPNPKEISVNENVSTSLKAFSDQESSTCSIILPVLDQQIIPINSNNQENTAAFCKIIEINGQNKNRTFSPTEFSSNDEIAMSPNKLQVSSGIRTLGFSSALEFSPLKIQGIQCAKKPEVSIQKEKSCSKIVKVSGQNKIPGCSKNQEESSSQEVDIYAQNFEVGGLQKNITFSNTIEVSSEETLDYPEEIPLSSNKLEVYDMRKTPVSFSIGERSSLEDLAIFCQNVDINNRKENITFSNTVEVFSEEETPIVTKGSEIFDQNRIPAHFEDFEVFQKKNTGGTTEVSIEEILICSRILKVSNQKRAPVSSNNNQEFSKKETAVYCQNFEIGSRKQNVTFSNVVEVSSEKDIVPFSNSTQVSDRRITSICSKELEVSRPKGTANNLDIFIQKKAPSLPDSSNVATYEKNSSDLSKMEGLTNSVYSATLEITTCQENLSCPDDFEVSSSVEVMCSTNSEK